MGSPAFTDVTPSKVSATASRSGKHRGVLPQPAWIGSLDRMLPISHEIGANLSFSFVS